MNFTIRDFNTNKLISMDNVILHRLIPENIPFIIIFPIDLLFVCTRLLLSIVFVAYHQNISSFACHLQKSEYNKVSYHKLGIAGKV